MREIIYITDPNYKMNLSSSLIGIDFETSGLDPFTDVPWLLTVAERDGPLYLIDMQRAKGIDLSILERKVLLGTHISFDLKFLRRLGLDPRKVMDVQILGYILTAGLNESTSLASLAKKYLNITMEKETRSSFIMDPNEVKLRLESGAIPEWTQRQKEYAVYDVETLFPIYDAEVDEILRKDLKKIAWIETNLIPVVTDIEYKGIHVDEKEWLKLAEEARKESEKLYTEIVTKLAGTSNLQTSLFPEATGDYIMNLNSVKEVKEKLEANGMKLSTLSKTEIGHIKDPLIAKLVAYKEAEKKVGTYGESWIALKNNITGRIHTDLNQMVATGRFSSRNPNIQNLPADPRYRKCFTPEKGYKFICADYSQIEMRILAEFSGDDNLITAFRSGVDMHSFTASRMFNVPIEQCGSGTEYRKYGKTLNFATIYGLGAKALALRLDLEDKIEQRYRELKKRIIRAKIEKEALEEAKNALDSYFRSFPSVKAWLDWAAAQPMLLGYSLTLLGRKRFFSKPRGLSKDEENSFLAAIKNMGKNSPIQGSNADIIKLAMINLTNEIREKGLDAYIVNVIHDELTVEVREDQADIVKNMVERNMIEAAQGMISKVPILVETKIADYWEK